MVRHNSPSWGLSVSQPSHATKKRLLPLPARSTIKKRPKLGPFLDESSSDSGNSDNGGDSDSFDFDGNVSVTTRLPGRSGRSKTQSPFDDDGIMAPRASLQRRDSNTAPKSQPFTSKTTTIPQSGKVLNKDRLKMLMAKKQGGSSRPSSTLESLRPMVSVQTDLRCRPMNGTHPSTFSEIKTTVSAGDEALGSIESPHNSAPGVHKSPFQHGWLHNAANSSSLRNILNTAKAEHCSVSKEPGNTGSEWRRAQAERSSTRSLKNVHRPEIGAGYGHTLTARKTNVVKKDLSNTKHTPAATSFLESSTPLQEHTAATPRGQALGNSSRSVLASIAATPVNRTFAGDPPRPAQTTRQKTTAHPANQGSLPGMRHNQTQSCSRTAFEQTDVPSLVKSIDGRREGVFTMPSAPRTPSSDVEVAARDDVATPQPRLRNARPDRASCATSVSPHGLGVASPAQQDALRSMPESVATSNRTKVGCSVYREASTVASTAPVVPARGAAPDATDATSLCYERPTARTPDAYGSCNTSVACVVRKEVPVAVMMRPERRSNAPILPKGDTGDTQSATSQELGTAISRSSNLAGATECFQLSTGKYNAKINALSAATVDQVSNKNAEEVASDVSDPAVVSASCPLSSVSEEVTPVSRSMLLHDAALEQRSSKLFEPTRTISLELAKAAPLGYIDSVCEERSPFEQSPRTSQSAFPPNPLSTEVSAQFEATAQISSPWLATEISLLQSSPASNISTDLKDSPTVLPVSAATPQSSNSPPQAAIALPYPIISPTAESYFEYTIHQALVSSTSSDVKTEISVQPLTSLTAANSQTEKLFQNAKQQYEMLCIQCKSTTTRINDQGLWAYEATFESTEDPSKTLSLRLWVQRAEVGVHANHTPSGTSASPSISKTVYMLKLWKLIDAASSEESESEIEDKDEDADEDEDKNEDDEVENEEKEQIRIYHPLPPICTEIHTSMHAANRAAKRVQIHLSHEKDPRQPLQKNWQRQNLQELNGKLEDLRKELEGEADDENGPPSLFEYEKGRRKGFWRSVFNGNGLGADRFELLLSQVGVSGPRNL